ncbi:MAG TPA: DinB family protein [Tepidisphaeraceae bacterium]|nr:DinB family protein [Tepidisphaeraceae bacterium]
MQSIDLIRWALTMTGDGLSRLAGDLRPTPMVRPTSAGGNHPIWLLGHLCFIEGAVRQMIGGEANPVDRWAKLFGTGTQPADDPGLYPSFDELLSTFKTLRQGTLRMLDEIGDAGLGGTPKFIPPGFEDAMKTTGRALLLIALHQMVHYGQLADARRAAGLPPLM